MKKISKLIYFMIAFALITCMAILNPAITFADAAEPSPSSDALSISSAKLDSVLENGKQLNIPMPNVSNVKSGDKVFVEVKDRSGYTYNYEVDTMTTTDKNGTASDYFNLLQADGETAGTSKENIAFIQPKIIGKGVYSIRYKVVRGDKTYYSSIQTVQVKSLAYNWEFDVAGETKNIIPANSNDTTTYVLPLPTITKADDETTAYTYTTADKGTNIKIFRDGTDVTDTEGVLTVDGENLKLTPKLEDGRDSAIYRVKYISKAAGFSNKEYEIRVSKDYETEATLEVADIVVTNAQAGATTTLPTANVTDKTHNQSKIAVNTVIVIKKGSVEQARLTNKYDYKFERGEYTVQYEVTDVYGNTAKSKTYSFSVSDRKPYVVDYANDYTVTETNGTRTVDGEVETGVEYLIPSEIGYGGVTLPAIYGMDYVDGHNLTFTRRIELSTDSTKYYDIDKAKGEHGNGSLTADNTEYNKAIKFTFPEDDASTHAGETYKVKYYATDSYGNEAFATVYTFTVADVETLSYTVDKGMSIKFPSITDNLDVKSELKFTSATASETPSDTKVIADERLEVRTYYYYGEKSKIEQALSNYKTNISNQEEHGNFNFAAQKYGYKFADFYAGLDASTFGNVKNLTSEDGYTTIKLDETEAAGNHLVTIFAVAINDQGQFIIKAQEVAIDNVTETDIPTINLIENSTKTIDPDDRYTQKLDVNAMSNIFNQNCDIYLPHITFDDVTDKSLEVTIQCYLNDPSNSVGVVIEKFAENGIELARVHAGSYGTYYVVVTARDDAGNTVSYVQSFEIQEVKKASVVVTNGSQFSKKVGETLSLAVELQGEGDYTDFDYDIVWDTIPGGLGSNKDSYKLEKEGTYNATINATYRLNGVEYNTSTTVTVTVSATSIDWTNVEDELVDRKESTGKIDLPLLQVEDNGALRNAYPTVKLVKDDKETEVEVKLNDNSSGYYFEADDGVYKVTYTVEGADYSTNKTKSYTITCGDIYEPTINITNDKLSGSTVNYNGEMSVSVSMTKESETGKYTMVVKATNADGTVFDYEMIVNITDKDKDQVIKAIDANSYSFELTGDSCSSDGINKWKISGVGDYKLKLNVKDKNNNESTKTIEFKVANKTEAKKNSDSVVGIVLIIISAVVLGGVILFFAFAGKKKSKKKISK